ncbi:MAG: tRNA (adenosine(37)-N6)-dimethylallyltransferase MiaA [Desulfobacteraceae bacterium]|nr:MAG: tRNA (adenosine(37)-N6)-dimethylallyltransferase MiaA [Desulfobacteraceae bacterium]
MNTDKPKVIVLCGPTASGKSSLGIELAVRFSTEIVNADSMQVYRGLDIGTAKPAQEERRLVPHHLLDLVDPDEPFNAAIFRQTALPVIAEINSRAKVPLLVGGTGLYIKTLLGGLMACPPLNLELRNSLQQDCREHGSAALHERLQTLDPRAAENIHPRDSVRIIRALEIIQLTGVPFSTQTQAHHFQESPFHYLKIYLDLDRAQLYQRINQRCLDMITKGLLQETQGLLEKGYSPALKSLKSIGYRHMIQYLQNRSSWDQAILDFQADTRRYAKRQITWFRADPEVVRRHPEQKNAIFNLMQEFLS